MSFHLAVQEVWHRVAPELLPSFIASFHPTVNRTGMSVRDKRLIAMTEVARRIELTLSTCPAYQTIM